MSLKRSCGACRMKTKVYIFVLTIILISMGLTYHALMNSGDPKGYARYSILPTMDKKRLLRFQHKISSDLGDIAAMGPNNVGLMEKSLLGTNIKDRDLLSADSKEAMLTFLVKLYPTAWALAEDTDEMALELKYLLVDYGFESKMTCKDIDRLKLGNPVSFSRSKYIEYAYFDTDHHQSTQDRYGYNAYRNDDNSYFRNGGLRRSLNVAVKSPSTDMDAKIACMHQVNDDDMCSTMGNYRLLREIMFMSTLNHPNIMPLKGYCLRGNRLSSKLPEKGLVMVTESGAALTPSAVNTLTWPQRVRMALEVSQLLTYLDSSPFGSLRLKKLDLKDFVLVGGVGVAGSMAGSVGGVEALRLVDLDELMLGELPCHDAEQCLVEGLDKGTECVEGFCDGLNQMWNLDKATRSILQRLLNYPSSPEASDIVKSLLKLNMTLPSLVTRLQALHKDVVKSSKNLKFDSNNINRRGRLNVNGRNSGVDTMAQDNMIHPLHRNNGEKDGGLSRFERQDQKNFAGIYDYPCTNSRVTWGCVHTVTSLSEVADLCLTDSHCRAFVTFTTRPEQEKLMTVVLKNMTDAFPHSSSGTTLFIRKSTKYDSIYQAVKSGDEAHEQERLSPKPKFYLKKKRKGLLEKLIGVVKNLFAVFESCGNHARKH